MVCIWRIKNSSIFDRIAHEFFTKHMKPRSTGNFERILNRKRYVACVICQKEVRRNVPKKYEKEGMLLMNSNINETSTIVFPQLILNKLDSKLMEISFWKVNLTCKNTKVEKISQLLVVRKVWEILLRFLSTN